MLDIALVVITRNRRDELLENLVRLTGLVDAGDAAEVVVVDNASRDGTARAVSTCFPRVRVVSLDSNRGAVGRTVGVLTASAPLVAFADDDSWWSPGALPLAAELFARRRRLGLVNARIVLEPSGRPDRVCDRLASGVVRAGTRRPAILGHVACAAVVRRTAYLGVGGYSRILGFGAEERLLSLDLATFGWDQWYVEEMVVHHRPSQVREDWPRRRARYRRNDTLTALLRYPIPTAANELRRFAEHAVRDPFTRREVPALVRALPRVVAERRRLPTAVLDQMAELAAAATVDERHRGRPRR